MSVTGPPLATDFDGTLVACEPRQRAVLAAALRKVRIGPVDLSAVWLRKRGGASTNRALVMEGMPPDDAARVARAWAEMVEDPAWLALDRPYPGVRETLTQLRSAGIPVVVVSARRVPVFLLAQLRALDLTSLIHAVRVVSPAHASSAKAAELGALQASAFIGDAESDADAARSAHTPFAPVHCGQRAAEFLASRGVSTSYDGFADAVVHLRRQGLLAPPEHA